MGGHDPMEPIAETTNGRIRGTAWANGLAFRGIRYGADTGGQNRFRAPQPPPRWAGVIDAITPGASAPQLPRPENTDPFHAWYSSIQPISEDCLFLNVFTPSTLGSRPIMFWIHGGGWREYSGTAPGFDGSILAASQDVVVITVNHRLNAFGFLRLDGADEQYADSGNAGLLDIAAALEWVRENASAFGGDPGNITLFGESGGGSKIAALLAMQRARGLFHKAVIQSSAGARKLASAEEAQRVARELAAVLDRTHLDPAELQTLPMQVLLKATGAVAGPYRGMVDGRSFTDDPFDHRAPATAVDVPLLIGCTNTEMTYFLRNDPRNFELEAGDVRRRLMRFFDASEAVVDRLIDAYRSGYPRQTASDMLITIATDHIFKRNNYAIAAMQAKAANVPVHAYLFEWETPVEGGRMRSPHTIDVPFVFGTVANAPDCIGTGLDVAPLADAVMSAWANFARTANPSNPAMPAWQPYDADGQKMMVINQQSRLESDPSAATRAALDEFHYFYYQQPMPVLARD